MDDLEKLYAEWERLKDAESDARDRRRALEDDIIQMLGENPSVPGTRKYAAGNHSASMVFRVIRKVDPEKLAEVTEGIDDAALDGLFRISMEANSAKWRELDEFLKRRLAPAITEIPARPVFKITTKGDQNG